MNLITLAATSVVLCAVPLSHVANTADGRARALSAETTIVIRYDPEVIFLTHDLVAPLCEREVVLAHESSDGPVGQLELSPMESNALQPRGVFVGRVRIDWFTGTSVPEPERDAVLVGGLDQLRKALSRRLVTPRHKALTEHARALQDAINELTVQIDERSRLLLQSDEANAVQRDLDESDAQMETADLERRSAQQELMVAMARLQKSEAALSAANALLQQIRRDTARTKALVEGGAVSIQEQQTAERELAAAEARLEESKANLLAERARVEQRTTQADLLDRRYERFQEDRDRATERMKRLPQVADDAERIQLGLLIELDRGRLTEAGVQLQQTRSALATLTEVSIERW
ncbi:MAG: hypothetical protein AAGI22_19835 [Planctomycetota bacterium]